MWVGSMNLDLMGKKSEQKKHVDDPGTWDAEGFCSEASGTSAFKVLLKKNTCVLRSKPNSDIPLDWLVYRDPYNGLS